MYDEVIIYNPHTCVSPKRDEPNCDFRSHEYANILSKYIRCILITSNIPRYIFSNDNTRNRLRPYIKPNNFILEIHSYTKQDNYWFEGQRDEPDIVLLETNNSDITKRIRKTLLPYYDVVIMQGSYENDLQREVNNNMSNGVLVELAYELSDNDIKAIAKLLKEVLEK